MERHTIYHETYYLSKGGGGGGHSKLSYSELIQTLKSGAGASSEIYGPMRDKIVLAVCITICNEPYSQFAKTMKCILKNVSLLCQNFDKISSHNIVVFLIQDGLEKVTPTFLDDAHRRIIRKEQFYSLLEFSSHEKSLAGHPNTTNHINKQQPQPPHVQHSPIKAQGADALYQQSSSTSERNFADLDMSGFNSTLNPYPSLQPQPHPHNTSGEDGTPRNTDANFVGKGGVIPMTDYAVRKWNESQLLHCFYTRASLSMLGGTDDDDEDRREVLHVTGGRVPDFWLVYGLKESNRGKLDSHRFFFDGFCRELNPRYCILTDCGTQFLDRTYYGFIQMGEMKPLMAGICSEIQTEWSYRKPHVMAQFIEYKIDQVLKSAEGLYGLVQILPGAHQFLKWSAVRGKALQIYCEGTEQHNYLPNKDTLGVFKRNVFLTEDKLITTLIMTREDQVHTINYLAGTKSFTDVPKTTVAILRQRRRWLNGGFSCTIYGFCLFCKDYKNSRMRKQRPCLGALLFLQLLYYLLQIFVQSNIAFEIISFYFLVVPFENVLRGQNFEQEFSFRGNSANAVLIILFIVCTALAFALSLFSNTRKKYAIVLFQILNWLFIGLNLAKLCGIFLLYHKSFHNQISEEFVLPVVPIAIGSIASIVLNYTTLFLIRPKEAFCNLHKYLLGFFFYLVQYNTFFYMVKIYLICNYSDVTWGSRAFLENKEHLRAIRLQYRKQNILLICAWLVMHVILIYTLGFSPFRQYLIFGISIIIVFQNLIRCIEALIFWWCRYARKEKQQLYSNYREPAPYERFRSKKRRQVLPPFDSINRDEQEHDDSRRPPGQHHLSQSWTRLQFNQTHSTHCGFTEESAATSSGTSGGSSNPSVSNNLGYFEKYQARIPALLRVSGVAESASSRRTARSTERLGDIEEEEEKEEPHPVAVSFEAKQGPQFFKFQHLPEQQGPASSSSVHSDKQIGKGAREEERKQQGKQQEEEEPDTPRLYEGSSFNEVKSEQKKEGNGFSFQGASSVNEARDASKAGNGARQSRMNQSQSSQFASQRPSGSHMSNLMIAGSLQGSEESNLSDNVFKSSGKNSSKDSDYSGAAGDSLWQNSSMQPRSESGSRANLNLTGVSLWGQDSGLQSSEQEESLKGSKVDSMASSAGNWFKESSLVRSEDEIKGGSSIQRSMKRSKVEEKKITEESNEEWTESSDVASSREKTEEFIEENQSSKKKQGRSEKDSENEFKQSSNVASSQKQGSSGWSYKQSSSRSDSLGEYL